MRWFIWAQPETMSNTYRGDIGGGCWGREWGGVRGGVSQRHGPIGRKKRRSQLPPPCAKSRARARVLSAMRMRQSSRHLHEMR